MRQQFDSLNQFDSADIGSIRLSLSLFCLSALPFFFFFHSSSSPPPPPPPRLCAVRIAAPSPSMARDLRSAAASASSASAAVATYRKHRSGVPAGFFACEAAGLRWLAEATVAGGPRVVKVMAVGDDHLDLERLDSISSPSNQQAREFGAAMAKMHATGAPYFGSLPPEWTREKHAWFGPLDSPYPMPGGAYDRWGTFYAECRLEPMKEQLRALGRLSVSFDTALQKLCVRLRAGDFDDESPPSRLHGDLWSGNVMWTSSGAVLIDPAAHGGHAETDLAMLSLFGAPKLTEIEAGYESVRPLREGWRNRQSLHQLYPVGMHAVFFGGSYIRQAEEIAQQWAK